MKKKEKPKEKEISGVSFIVAGIVVMMVPAFFYVFLGDLSYFLQRCVSPFSTIEIDGIMTNCTEIRFVYVLSYFCILFGMILVILGLAKKIMESKK